MTATEKQGNSSQAAAALFDAMHDALLSEARGVARECGVDVRTGRGVALGERVRRLVARDVWAMAPAKLALHEALLRAVRAALVPEERVQRLVARNVSAMAPAELAVHEARLRAVRAALVRRLQGEEEEENERQGVDGDVEVVGAPPPRRSSKRRR